MAEENSAPPKIEPTPVPLADWKERAQAIYPGRQIYPNKTVHYQVGIRSKTNLNYVFFLSKEFESRDEAVKFAFTLRKPGPDKETFVQKVTTVWESERL